MNLPTFERAQLAAFAYQQARHTGNLECLRGVCFVIRNRVKAGWGDGWLSVMGSHGAIAGNHSVKTEPAQEVSLATDRLLQMIVRDVDDIYMGQDRSDDSTRMVALGDAPPKTSALYFMFVDRPITEWFAEKIVRRPVDHPQIGNIGSLMLFK